MLSILLSVSPVPTYLLLIPIFYISYNVLLISLDPLRDIPGLLLARFTRFWYLYASWRGDFERTNINLHRRYGPIVRIAPGEYSIDDVEAVRKIFALGSGFAKAPWYTAWGPPDPSRASLFTDMDAQRHASQRRKFAAAYSMSSLITYEPYVDSCTSILIQQLQELAASEKTVNLAHWLQYYAFDVIGSMSFGRRFGFLDAGEDKENIFDAIETRNLYSTLMGVFPSLHPWLFPLLPKTGAFGYIAGYTRRQMSEKFAQEKQPDDTNDSPDFLSRFSAIHAANPDKMSTTDIFTITQTNVGAGSDTVALTLSAALYHMAKNPSTYSRLQDELDVAANEGRISDPITFAQAQKLPYLQAVLKEALRIHPAMGLPMVRTVPEGGATLCGRFFPAGSTVGVNAWVAHRNKSVFGDDADIWRPERWLEFEKQGRGAEVERYFLAFGLGSRTCLGKNIALLEINKIVPQLVRGFEVVLGEDLMRRDVKTVNRGFVKMNDFEVKVVARKREKEEGREA